MKEIKYWSLDLGDEFKVLKKVYNRGTLTVRKSRTYRKTGIREGKDSRHRRVRLHGSDVVFVEEAVYDRIMGTPK